jgi:hypothetical protein
MVEIFQISSLLKHIVNKDSIVAQNVKMTTENVLLRLRNFFLQFIFWHNLWLPSIKKKIFPMIGKQSTLKLSKVK